MCVASQLLGKKLKRPQPGGFASRGETHRRNSCVVWVVVDGGSHVSPQFWYYFSPIFVDSYCAYIGIYCFLCFFVHMILNMDNMEQH